MIIINIVLITLLFNSVISTFTKNNHTLCCGIVGFSSPTNKKFNIDKIKLLLMLNQERGKDSYGYYTKETGVIKQTGKIEECLIKDDFKVPESNMFIGHVRTSSVGMSTQKNAHPFQYGNIVLVMNGTLSNHWNLCTNYGFKTNDFDVDSQVLTAIIDKEQNKSVLSKIDGGCAIMFSDTNTGIIYCYRNSERPLFMGMIDKGMYISSTENSLKIIGCSDVKEFEKDMFCEIVNGKITKSTKIKRLVKDKFIDCSIYTSNGLYKNINMFNTASKDLVGEWLTPENTLHMHNGGSFYHGYRYKCVGYSKYNTYDIDVKDNDNKTISISKFKFEAKIPILCTEDFVFAVERIKYANPIDGIYAEKGNLLRIKFVNKNKLVCDNLVNDKSANIEKSMCRHAMPQEVTEYKAMFLDGKIGPKTLTDDDYYSFNGHDLFDNDNDFLDIKRENTQPLLPPAKSEPIDENDNNDLPYKVAVYKLDIDESTFNTYKELAIFTIDNIQDLMQDLSECSQSNLGEIKLGQMKILIDNYESKVLELTQISTNK